MKLDDAITKVEELALTMLMEPAAGLAAVAVSTKEGGAISGATDFAVTAYVPKKLPVSELQAKGVRLFADVYQYANKGVPAGPEDIDVVEAGSMFEPQAAAVPALQRGLFGGPRPVLDAQKWFSTLRVGIGITNPINQYPNGLSVGTLGFFLTDENGRIHLVSNNHVIGRSNDGGAGEAVVQPGTLDLTAAELQVLPTLNALVTTLQIAQLTAVVPIAFITPQNIPINRVDAALAELTDSGRGLEDINRLTYGGRIRGVAAPYLLDPMTGALTGSSSVYKVGRTTGYTEGTVIGIAGTALVPYPGGNAFFAGQLVIRATADNVGPFSRRGDSGSGILNDQHELVGLLFAGSDNQTIANPIADVLGQLSAASGLNLVLQ